MSAFSIGRLPRIEFGSGSVGKLPSIAVQYGTRFLIVTGGWSFTESRHWAWLQQALRERNGRWEMIRIAGEPSPESIDAAVREWGGVDIDAVIGIGGGSVLDAAKAIAGLLRPGHTVMDHLEGVGPELDYRGPATPFIAVPTTAGTGSEATRNAVLTRHGADGFKKSFRDDKLMAEYAIVDPDLLAPCPPDLIAANGMDAFTQLLESYVSIRANPVTDALALAGMEAVRDGLMAWYQGGEGAAAGREHMALAALLSGICLAQTGLGSVHGLAQPLGSFFPIPHGVVCGALVAAATQVNIEVMLAREPENPALAKYAKVGRLFMDREGADDDSAREGLIRTLRDWTRLMKLPLLSILGVKEADFTRIVAHSRGSSMKTNPVVLSDAEIERILRFRYV
jgi:alcohol dehydrogenase